MLLGVESFNFLFLTTLMYLSLAKMSLRKHHESLRYLGKSTEGHFDLLPHGLLNLKVKILLKCDETSLQSHALLSASHLKWP